MTFAIDEAKSEMAVLSTHLLAEKNYWLRKLKSCEIPGNSLRLDFPRSVVFTGREASIDFNLNGESYQKLKDLTGNGLFLMYTALMATLKITLHKYTGETLVIVGSPSRAYEIDDARQPANALAIMDRIDPELTFREFLMNVRQTLLETYQKQQYPFDRLLRDLEIDITNRCALFDIAMSLTEIHDVMPEVKNDLMIRLRREGEQLNGSVDFNSNLYERKSINEFLKCWRQVIKAVLKNTEIKIGEVSLLDEIERQRILVTGNETARDYPREQSIQQLFEAQVERTPDAVAVVFEEQPLSYRELNERANQLAHHLVALGVGVESRVGICLERSEQLVVGLLGILKAGGAYVPLDPQYPTARLSFMVADSGLKVLLTEASLRASLSLAGAGLEIISVDSEWDEIARQPVTNPRSEVSGANLAYIIYTSGSTGQPKGIGIAHYSVNRLVLNSNYLQLESDDRIAQASNASFDAATFEIWGALLNGATLCIIPAAVVLAPAEFAAALQREQITVLFLTTALFNQMAREARGGFNGLRHLLFGGQAVEPQWVGQVLEDGYEGRLLHVYGPTESTTFASWEEVREVREGARSIAIGQALANTRQYVLGARLEAVPEGVVGELYLGGEGLARGYLNQAELTAERFVPDPHSRVAGERMYRTGDLVRGVGGGRVEFIGRVDQQVKVRGYRVELEEVGVVLSEGPGVAAAVVEARGGVTEGEELRLVGYVVAGAGQTVVVRELREYLQERLPSYMIPSVYVVLAELPLTPNGKVDRRALPEPEPGTGGGEGYVGPRTATEEIVAGIWASVLKLERVGVTENFFDLGGHSLLATQVMSRIRESFVVELALLELFEHPTVGGLSRRIEEAGQEGEGLSVPPLIALERSIDTPLSFAQQRLWFLNQLEPESPFYNMPAAMKLTGKLNAEALERSLSEIVRRHEALRTTFPSSNGKPVQLINEVEPIEIRQLDLSGLAAEVREVRVGQLAAEEAQRPFDLERGPLLRVTLLLLGADEHILLLTMHHIISDGWSIDVLIRELGTLYEAYSAGEEPRLEELSVQYADYAVWQRDWLQGEVLERQLGYWKKVLVDEPALLTLPTDRARPAVQTFRGSVLSVALPAELSKGLKELSQRQGATLFMTLLAAFDTLLYRYSGQKSFSVGSAIANRNRAEVEGLIGFFVNTLVLSADLSGNPTFKELLGRVREVTLGAYAHQDMPFEKLVEELQPERALSHSPLFQVMFVLQNTPVQMLHLRNLTLSAVDAASKTAKFDLILSSIDAERGIVLSMEYSTDLFEAETIGRMLRQYEILLAGIVSNPDERVATLQLLTEGEQEQLLYGWNETARDYPREQSIQQLFEAQVERTPDAVAVVFEEQPLSYRELNERANQLAHHLVALGVGVESRVGICLERSEQLVVGLLGILKAGGAYVPLDPQYPTARLSFMVADSGLKVLLTEASLRASLSLAGAGLEIISVDSEWDEIARQPVTNPRSEVSGANLAYIIYTSGSTGQPKGIGIAHYSVNRLVLNSNYLQLESDDRIAQASNASFDAATFEIWGALLNGATLCIIPAAVVLAPAEFAAALQREQITVLFLTTALFNQMAREARGGFNGLRHLLFGGQAVEPQWVGQVLEDGYEGRLLHVYGPTESTTFASWEEVREVREGARSIAIGQALANTRQYVLGARLEAVPEGVVGELYLGGEGLARGYLNQAELTAERFVPDPHSRVAGERMYRTGDLVRGVGGGRVEFIGRVDQQVKVRGYRVELEEVGVVLSEGPGVAAAVVEARGGVTEGEELRLVGYVVAGAGQTVVVRELREYLQERLPSYMIPSVYVVLAELPLTPNGKVDRRALPEPEPGTGGGEGYVGPRTATEEIVAGIWASVLKLERVGVTENFFEIGGHSLLATQVMSRIRESFAVELPLRELFEQATVAGLSKRVEETLQSGAGVLAPPIVAVDHEQALPLSFAQQRLWFLDQLQPHSGFYNIPSAIRFKGELKLEALEWSFNEIVQRHEALRTRFTLTEGEPVQTIQRELELKLKVIELGDLEAGEREARASELVAAEAQAPFDLSRGPLLRVQLLRLNTNEHVLLLTMHHIISDGWSMGVLIRELTQLYEAYSRGEASPLAELPIQYADFAVWQREWLQGEVLEGQLQYWREQLATAPAVLELPADRARPAVQSYRGAVYSTLLPVPLSAALKQLSRDESVTLFMMLLAAFDVLLYRYSGQEDICVGSAIANRNRAETEGLIGFFVNTLVLRGDLSGNPSFKELLSRVREVTLGAYAHQDVPFEKLVEELQPVRALSHAPLFQVMLNLQHVSGSREGLAGLELGAVAVEARAARFDLLVSMNESEAGLSATVEYSTDLFDEETIARLLRQYETLLAGIVADPNKQVSALALLSEKEREQLVEGWNETGREYERERCIHELFEAQVERTPEATALVFAEQELSYRELNERANQLAHHLRSVGVGVESRVGVCVERSAQMIVGLLGILKAGAAYVPLDPQYPAARLSFMLEDAAVTVLLTESGLAALPGDAITVVSLDTDWDLIATQRVTNLESVASAANLAYIIYTSGSSGVPKGVAIAHQSTATLLHWAAEHFPPAALSGVLASTSICFDLSVFEIFVPLSWGGTVILAENALALPGLSAAVTLLNTVPSALTELVRSNGLPASVAVVSLAGEALPVSLVERLYEQESIGAVWNLYGPTEDTTYSTGAVMVRGGERAPIGKPLANTRAYVLDGGGEVAPVGVAGELYLGGEGLARGYWQRAALTAERFVPDGLSGRSGERLYRTGDLVKWSRDGELEYLGRLDQQVKVRGYRIELGEVEAELRKHAGIREAVVVVREEEGDKRLVGYVVLEEGQAAVAVSELRPYLKERLPEYMIPGVFVLLEELPLTANGKVDRRALPEPGQSGSSEAASVAPRTATEEIVAGIWASVLKLERVGVTENFFEMGGHSLLATQVMSRIRESLAVELPLRELFEHATVAGLSQRVDETLQSGAGELVPPIVAVDHDEPLPLSFAQQRLWFLDQLEPESAFYNIPSAVRLNGQLNEEALTRSLSEIVRRHEALRTVFARSDGEPVQVIRAAEPFTLEQLDLSALPAAEREARAKELAAAEAQQPFDLSRGPLLRVKLLHLGADEHVLLLTMHHIISDGWSIGVLIRELTALYEAYRRGEESPLAELPIQYADYAVWQREWLQGEVLDGQMEYWRKQLAGASPALELPMDRMRPAMQSYRGAAQTVLLPVELSNSLKELSQRQGATLFMTLLAALETLLYRYGGQEDFCIGSPIANRNRADIESLIGFFVNTLVLRADLSGNPTFIELLHKVRNVALEAYAHQDVPFEQLVEELQPERALSHSPLFQVMFFIQNTPMSPLELSGMTLQPVQAQSDSVKFDLALIMQETNSGLVGRIEYSTDLFDHSTITRFVDHFRNLLQGIVADPQQSLMALPLLTTDERELMETEWNDVKEYKHTLVHELFEAVAAKDPGAVALSIEDRQIAYGELNAISNQITHGLLGMGIQPGQNIPVLLEDSAFQVEALLGILKAGAVFVCLDPTYPPARIKQILEELDAPCLISETSVLRESGALLQQIAHDTDLKLIGLDVLATESGNFEAGAIVSGAEWLNSNPTHNVKVDVAPAAPVYIVFTSGSTGKPKGIVQSHQSFCQFLTWQSETFEIIAPKRIAQWASTIYDASYCEIFGTLCFGATLCLTTPLVRHDPFAVINWINEEKISLLQVVPSFCRQMLQVLDSSATDTKNPFPTLERMLLAGEVLPTDVARDWWARFQGDVKLYNLYGPSETILATSYSVEETPETQASIPVGRAIDGRQILILDEQKKLCPIGVKGEIHVRSPYLTLGYFKRSNETQRSFIQNPLHSDYPDPVYCTGDIGRWLVDGNVEFCGRRDNQVKIRGMRVELEEIESALLRFPAIEECVVTAHDYGDGDKRLVAYLKPNRQSAPMEDDSNSARENQHLSQYQDIYDEIYGQTQDYAPYDPGLNLRIWVNSYTGQPFRKDEIIEGVEDTVRRIMSLQPRDVLDIGCGSGLLLFRIAPGCRSYLGTDISQKAVQYLDHQLSVQTPKISGVTLRHQAAHDFTGIEPNAFDSVIINDVHIYFPSIEYFVSVLEGAVKAVRQGGAIFIGGVRSLPLLKAFHTSVQLYRSSASLSKAALIEQVHNRMESDKELVIDPAFFSALQRILPDISRVEMQLKGGRSHNEMTRFQYDVILRIGSRTEGKSGEIESLNWQDNKISAAGIRTLLEKEKPVLLAVRRVLNARVAADVKAVELLETDDGLETASDVRQALQHLSDEAVDPEDLWILKDQLPYDVEINGNNSHLDQYDTLFRRRGSGLTRGLESAPLNGVKPWSQYANNPTKVKFDLQIEPKLRAFLKECLPEHLIPASFIFLDTLPRTRTGKIDRKNLPQPESQRSRYGGQYIAPETEMELLIAEVWQKLLRVDRVGINDNFFELGGHSLLATQVINKLRESYSVELPLRTIFESPTIAGLVKQVELAQKQGQDDADKMAQIIQKIKNLSVDEVAAEMKALEQVSRPS